MFLIDDGVLRQLRGLKKDWCARVGYICPTIIKQTAGIIAGSVRNLFHKKLSLSTDLLRFLDEVAGGLIAGKQAGSTWLDFIKTFDSLNPHLLLINLVSYDIQGRVHHWAKAFLVRKIVCVKVKCSQSDNLDVTSSVQQRPVLQLKVYLLFINNSSSVYKSSRIFSPKMWKSHGLWKNETSTAM